MSTALIWFRLDLRVQDNAALQAAIRLGLEIVPVYIWPPEDEHPWDAGGASKWFLHHALKDLQQSLEAHQLKLIIRKGDALEVLKTLIHETNAQAIFWNRQYEPQAIERDTHIKKTLINQGLHLQSFNSSLLYDPLTIRNKTNNPFQVFTPFWKHCITLGIPEPIQVDIQALQKPNTWPKSDSLDSLELLPKIPWDTGLDQFWQKSIKSNDQRLTYFIKNIVKNYQKDRNYPAKDGTSCLSPYLHFGQLGPRQIIAALKEAGCDHHPSAQVFTKEIVWREFAYHLLYHFPDTPDKPLKTDFERFPWVQNKHFVKAWQRGKTGYPLVDAGMRQLWETGWLHNRIRMVVGSFLVKHLLQPWQVGSKWFWDTLVDADLANNTLGWQWVCGCGADAAPYFRVFNPVLQSEKFDFEGLYIKRYVPELKNLQAPYIHRPWEAPESLLLEAGIVLGKDYPHPIVELTKGRDAALAAYNKIKN
jgi:deoxyribodipyrimidine photo-lyase